LPPIPLEPDENDAALEQDNNLMPEFGSTKDLLSKPLRTIGLLAVCGER
jgi:hypothetical protein